MAPTIKTKHATDEEIRAHLEYLIATTEVAMELFERVQLLKPSNKPPGFDRCESRRAVYNAILALMKSSRALLNEMDS